ncbi:hypothetical protein N431DRAFT_433080 [Stipitochalara longipes BDJ]|nr:hypothetical protein N431DRAFT_433080 [Stipitochalara longipes BDJ]
MATLHRLTRISMLVKRNPALSTCEFQRRWCRIWGPLSAPFLKRIGFNTYLQIPLKTPDTTLQLGGPEFDAFADLLVPSYEAFLLVWETLFYNDDFDGDGRREKEEWLIDPDSALIVNAGVEEVYLFSPISP